MIDLIIPYYNNPKGLITTLDSINTNIFYITIIDDGSDDYIPYHPAINQVFRQVNAGPGAARQLGINKTNNSYIMFIDTGDIFLSKNIQQEVSKAIYLNPDAELISFLYYHKNKLTSQSDNRMHGKIYKRRFINKYNITFCPESSYLDEDIGFNLACKIIIDSNKLSSIFLDIPLIDQICDNNSLTQRDNRASLYRDQTKALALNSIHAINISRKYKIEPTSTIHYIAVALYYWFLRTAAERPIYIQQAWSGAKIFYDYFKNEIQPNQLTVGMKKCLQFRNQISFSINILRFVNDILNNEIIPDKYLT